MTAVIVQCRLSSMRLPQKALLPLDGKPLLRWTLDAMRQVPADAYILACDFDSEAELRPLCEQAGWQCFAGPKNDVLERFCRAATQFHIDTIVRATGDNPFLFYEAAALSLTEALKLNADYFTFTGLPHGSGVEVLKAQALLRANVTTSDPYEREHVGPALYQHRDVFQCIFAEAPEEWRHPDLRTTVDTPEDYRRAGRLARALSGNMPEDTSPSATAIIGAFTDPIVTHPILCVPSVQKGRGTGHLRRMLSVAAGTGADIYIPPNYSLAEAAALLDEARTNGLSPEQILSELPPQDEYKLILADTFSLTETQAQTLSALAPLAAIDEGSVYTAYCDYLLDIIPSYKLSCKANTVRPDFIPLPVNRRASTALAKAPKTVLVAFGGEDPAGFTARTVAACIECGKTVTAVDAAHPVANLKESLHLYDAVITHYGFTAFEAAAAGCAVILFGTTPLHIALAKKYGFARIPAQALSPAKLPRELEKLFNSPEKLYPVDATNRKGEKGKEEDKATNPLFDLCAFAVNDKGLSAFVRRLAAGVRLPCPVCGKTHPELDAKIIARTPERTYRRCGNCGIIYIAWTCSAEKTDYNKDYFFADYKNQYGKTYLEDFDSIKAQGKRRCDIINSVHKRQDSGKPTLLDVGCAYGPFLSAASDAGWNVFGLDVSKSAVDYVRETLHFQAKCGDFAGFDKKNAFDVTKVTIGRADKWLVDNAKQVALDIADYTHEITVDFVKHIIKRHTNEGSERERGNVAITDEDIKNIPKIIYNSDYVIFGTKRYGEERIIYVKKVEKGTALYFEEILLGKKNKSLRGVTLFKRKEDLSENKLYAILKSNTKNDVSNAKIVVGDGGQSIVEANNIVDPTAATSARPIDNSINNIARLLDSVNSFTEKKAVKRQQKFDAITMWYVIEHFQQLGAALDTVSAMLKEGGIFAFSTPSAAGVSGTRNTDAFFAASPRDHYTVWEPAVARSLLQERGFKIARVVSTGHHPERFPLYKKISRFPLLVPKDSVALKPCKTLLSVYSRLFHLGDTFEIYCIKTGGIYE